jgi:hypothetical protein
VSAAVSVAVDERGDVGDGPARVAQLLRASAPLLAAALVCAVAASLVAPYPAGIFHDDGVYLVLAKALASGNGYRYLHLPGAPLATHYPPVYPVLLALLWMVAPRFPSNLTIILLANAALLGLVAWGSARYLIDRLEWPSLGATAFALVATLSLPLIQLTTLVMSEVLFLALLFPVLTQSERAVGAQRSLAHDVALGGAAGALALIRIHGLVLAIAVALLLATRREWRRAAFVVAGAAIVLLPWQLWVILHDATLPAPLRGSYGSYVAWLADGISRGGPTFVARTVARNAGEVAAILADRFAPWQFGMLRLIPLSLILALLAFGAVKLRRRAPVLTVFIAAYFVVMLVWPYNPWRFMWGVWPLVLLLAAEGASTIVRWRPIARPAALVRYALFAPLAVLALGLARAEIVAYRDRAWAAPVRDATRTIAPVMRWISQNTRPHEAVIADAEPLVYLFTERPAMPPVAFTAAEYVTPRNPAADVASLANLVRQFPVRYVITVVPSTMTAARALALPTSTHPITLREVDSLPGAAVFEVMRPSVQRMPTP